MASPQIVARIKLEYPMVRLAVLIDTNNAQAAALEKLLAKVALFGEATVKNIYGDFKQGRPSS